jgi:septal ring-binding cell division protein DamX
MPPENTMTSTFFETPARTERLQLLLHLIRNTGPAIYLRGPDGAGKTRFGRRLIEEIGDEFGTAVLDAATQTDLAAALTALSARPTAPLVEVVRELCERRLLLLIDNADHLESTAAGVLASWHDAGGPLLLLGRGKPEALSELLDLQYVDLPPFDEAESGAFLREQAGGMAARVTDDLAAAVHSAAAGLPGALLHALERMRAEESAAAAARKPPKDPGEGRRGGALYWVAALLVVGVLAAGLVYQDRINALFEPAPADQLAATPARDPAAIPPPVADPVIAQRPGPLPQIALPELSVPPPAPVAGETVETLEGAETADKVEDAAAAERLAADVPEPSAAEVAPPGPLSSPDAAVLPPAAGPDPLEAVMADAFAAAEPRQDPPLPQLSSDQPPAAVETAVVAAAPDDAAGPPPTARPEPVAPAPVEERPVAAESPRPLVRTETLTPAPRPVPRKQFDSTGGEAWLTSRSPDHYTLQLVGARERVSIEKFIRDHRITPPYAVFARELDGRPWYSLVVGDYPDRDAAIAARGRLPAALRAGDVWPRTFGSIEKIQ